LAGFSRLAGVFGAGFLLGFFSIRALDAKCYIRIVDKFGTTENLGETKE
jgi:hypothetical protein